jgi:hypothetical protein
MVWKFNHCSIIPTSSPSFSSQSSEGSSLQQLSARLMISMASWVSSLQLISSPTRWRGSLSRFS